MNGPGWILVPWAVFAIAAGIKAWRLWRGVRPRSTERDRRLLERSWQRSA
ncbi:MAG: hypothetical protein VKL97_02990 [Cyanobacteriota bacterium]|nr:hypothetical protein [Cyanobacteriota bacterium]